MATKVVANGGGNYNVGATWVGGVAPLTTDDIAFTSTSGDLTINVTSTCAGINFTNYVGTITFSAQLSVNGNINLGTGGYTQAGASRLQANATGTLTSNGVTWTRELSFGGTSATYTLADNWIVTGILTVGGTSTTTINGFSINARGNLTHSSAAIVLGTTKIILNGTGTWSHSLTGTLRNNVDINTTGTTTFGTNVRYNTGTLKYVSGTVTTAGSTFTMDLATTLDTNGTSINFNNLVLNGTGAILTLTTDCYCASFVMGVNAKTINGANLYNAGSLAAPSNTGNVQGTSTIIMNGTGTISAAGGAYIGINLTINTAGVITLATCNYGIGTFKYIAGTVNSTGTVTIVQGIATLDTVGMSFLNLSLNGSFTNPLHLPTLLTVTGTLFFPTNTVIITGSGGFTCGTLTMGQGTLTLPAGVVNTVTTSMTNTTATLAIKGLINCSTVNGAKAILNLVAGANQDNGYQSATDVDSSGGRSIWTYKGTLTRTINWNKMSTNPKKHVLNYKNRILK